MSETEKVRHIKLKTVDGFVNPVRCAECRHAQMWWSHGIGRLECDAWSHMRSVPVDPNDYCSRGELREP